MVRYSSRKKMTVCGAVLEQVYHHLRHPPPSNHAPLLVLVPHVALDGHATRNTTPLLSSTRPGYTPISSPDSSGHPPVAHLPPPSPLLPSSPLPPPRSVALALWPRLLWLL
jgi:hypothetical protein